jgi:branched-chain amino acid transport system ATP-binding protein
MADLLVVDDLVAGYDDAVVLDGISFSLAEGESLALLGRNGVGKTTLLLSLMGFTRQHGGCIRWKGADLSRLAPYQRARAGLGWVPQERRVFPSLTVEEHLAAVARPGPWTLARVFAAFPRLAERRGHRGHQLSGGEQQMLAIGRALMLNPRLLLLDEPMEGLAPVIVQELRHLLVALIVEGGMSFILVEQHARLALALTGRTIVLDRGRVVHAGASRELLQDEEALHRLIALS